MESTGKAAGGRVAGAHHFICVVCEFLVPPQMELVFGRSFTVCPAF
jgi:hypothetical protein